MTKTSIAAAVFASFLPLIATAGPATHVSGRAAAHPAVVQPDATLYSQNGTDSGNAVTSQNFETSFDAYDASAADDFTVTGTSWTVSEVDIPGQYSVAGPARDETVTFYKNKQGHPGKVAKTQTAAGVDTSGSFAITIPKSKLLAGKYWIGVQANMDFGTSGQWYWENQVEVVKIPAMWENPGDGFGTGCTTWSDQQGCLATGVGDQMFTLKGKKVV